MRRCAATALLLAAAACNGCAWKGPSITIDPAPYTGPEAAFDASGRTHLARFTAPTGGWSVRLDHVRDRFDARQAFITLRAPDPGAPVTQALTTLVADTTIRTTDNAEVFVRVLRSEEPDSGAYRAAGVSPRR